MEFTELIKNKYSTEQIDDLIEKLEKLKQTLSSCKGDIPRTWEEYCKNLEQGYYIDSLSEIAFVENKYTSEDPDMAKNVLPTKELAEAHLAFMQLTSLRKAWIKDWEPDWSNIENPKHCINFAEDKCNVFTNFVVASPLCFPTKEMAKQFVECFKDLIEKAKILI